MNLTQVILISLIITMSGITFANPSHVSIQSASPMIVPLQPVIPSRQLQSLPTSSRIRGELGNIHLQPVRSNSSSILMSQVPRLPPWNQAAPVEGDSRHIDFSQLFDLMGEPRGSPGRDLSDLMIRPKPKCNRRIKIFNGVTRVRERGSLARFQCSHGFTLIGPMTIVCLRDRWSEPPPICVKSGCRPLRRPEHGEMRQSIKGAVAAFFCYPHAQLIGDPVIFCDGIKWNSTEPTCHVEHPTTTTEKEPEEVWPVSVLPPSLENSGEELDHDPTFWDTNNQQIFESSTIPTMEAAISTTHEDNEWTTSTEVVEFSSSSEPPLGNTDKPLGREADVHHQFPETSPEPSTSPQQEFNHEIPSTTLRSTDAEITGHPETTKIHQPTTTIISPAEFNKTDLASTGIPFIIRNVAVTDHPQLHLVTVEPTVAINVTIKVSTTTTTTQPPPRTRRTTPPRRVKTKRPRRPVYTRRPTRRPYRRTTTTPSPTFPNRRQTPTIARPTYLPPVSSTSTNEISGDNDAPSRVDYPIAIDKEFLPREQVQPIRPLLIPDMLNNKSSGHSTAQSGHMSHISMIGGITLFVVGLSSFSAGVILYCWRKNKGIARATPYDLDGRTLSAHDANDDFMWLDQRDSRL